MRAATSHFLSFGLAFILAACGEVRWVKPGADEAAMGPDLANCRAAAHSSIQRMYGVATPNPSGHGPLGAPMASDPSLADRQMREQEIVGRCMREKGYTLVPVEK